MIWEFLGEVGGCLKGRMMPAGRKGRDWNGKGNESWKGSMGIYRWKGEGQGMGNCLSKSVRLL